MGAVLGAGGGAGVGVGTYVSVSRGHGNTGKRAEFRMSGGAGISREVSDERKVACGGFKHSYVMMNLMFTINMMFTLVVTTQFPFYKTSIITLNTKRMSFRVRVCAFK